MRKAGIQFAAREGVLDRAVYNAIEPESTREELDLLGEVGVKHAVILACGCKGISGQRQIAAFVGERRKTGTDSAGERTGCRRIY